MSWVSENKFLAGFGAVMIAGLGALGYLTYSAMGKYDDEFAGFKSAKADLSESLKSPTDGAALKNLLDQKKELATGLQALHAELKRRVPAVAPLTKEAFQDSLKQTVARVLAKAAESRVTLPKGFYMGCEAYQSKPPEDAAATLLARQLAAMDSAMDILVQLGGVDLQDLKRELLPEEQGTNKAPAVPAPRGGAKVPADKPKTKLVDKVAFTMKFTSTESAFRQILNAIVGHKGQYFVVRRVEVRNERPEPPPKVALVAPPPPPPPPNPQEPGAPAQPPFPQGFEAPAAAAPAPKKTLDYIFGAERVIATLQIEALNFSELDLGKEQDGRNKDR